MHDRWSVFILLLFCYVCIFAGGNKELSFQTVIGLYYFCMALMYMYIFAFSFCKMQPCPFSNILFPGPRYCRIYTKCSEWDSSLKLFSYNVYSMLILLSFLSVNYSPRIYTYRCIWQVLVTSRWQGHSHLLFEWSVQSVHISDEVDNLSIWYLI